MDVSALDPASSGLDSAVAVCFSPAPRSHLLVSLSSNKVVVLDAISGRLVREVSPELGSVAWCPLGSHLGVPVPEEGVLGRLPLLRGVYFEKGGFPGSGGSCALIISHDDVLLQFCDVHPVACSALALSGDARLLLTAADRAIKVWDYVTQSDASCQVGAVQDVGGCRQAGEEEGGR